MLQVALRRNDGLASGRPWLRSVVRTLQIGLRETEHPVGLDGRFGSKTEIAVKSLQRGKGLLDTGVVGKATWQELRSSIDDALGDQRELIALHLPEFAGDLGWVHEQEGHRGGSYWPGGSSGVTLDPGVDFGHANETVLAELVETHYKPFLSAGEEQSLVAITGLRGQDAMRALRNDPVLRGIRISREIADGIMPVASSSYWATVKHRFPTLAAADTLPSIQTVLLSLAYNRGAGNRHLGPLGALLEQSDWLGVARTVGSMQQRHELHGIRRRRREEAALINAELEFQQS